MANSLTHHFHLLALTICLVILAMYLTKTTATGLRDFGEDCDIRQIYADESKKCDSLRGLFCNQDNSRCRCFIPGLYYQTGKCRSKVRRQCGEVGGYRLDCVLNAFCNSTSNLCECQRGHESNEENTACFDIRSNGADRSFEFSVWILITSIVSSWFISSSL